MYVRTPPYHLNNMRPLYVFGLSFFISKCVSFYEFSPTFLCYYLEVTYLVLKGMMTAHLSEIKLEDISHKGKSCRIGECVKNPNQDEDLTRWKTSGGCTAERAEERV